jgi:membrane-bound ClpP family serine protease
MPIETNSASTTATPRFDPFRLLSEFIVLCLGALLLVLSFSGRAALPAKPVGLIALGVLCLYMAARAFTKPEAGVPRIQSQIRAVSLAVVGIVLINIAVFHPHSSLLLLGIAGVVLVIRGLLGAIIALRRK